MPVDHTRLLIFPLGILNVFVFLTLSVWVNQMADHLTGMLYHYLEWELNADPVTLLGPVHTPLTFYHPHTTIWSELNADPVTLLGPVHTPLIFYHPH
jgi:hypothetical protein